jgi:hypothetical protein
MYKKVEMKRSKLLWSLVAVFVIVLTLWLCAGRYPYAIYEYHQTGGILEYLDRLVGLEVEAVPIFIPNNPLWVDVIRRIAPFTLFILTLAILYVLFGRKKEGIPSRF